MSLYAASTHRPILVLRSEMWCGMVLYNLPNQPGLETVDTTDSASFRYLLFQLHQRPAKPDAPNQNSSGI